MTLSSLTAIDANRAVLQQGIGALERCGAELFRLPAADGQVTSTGPHFRHILDHYGCFLRGLATGRVDYDARERDPALETDPARAAVALAEAGRALAALDPAQGERRLQVHAASSPDEEGAMTWADSTVQRELMFLLSHTVHHYALIALLAHQGGIELGEDFGVAPSTLAHWRRNLACAR
jgi:uncharacterized damage-inducible protein DinB